MNYGLLDGFRHNNWATARLLDVCRGLNRTDLDSVQIGAYGTIYETLWHIVSSDASYCARLTGTEGTWDRRARVIPPVDTLLEYNEDLGRRWEEFLAMPFDAEHTFAIPWDTGPDRDVPAGVILAQALHHANEHRAQVASMLTSLGVEPPNLGVWEWSEVSNRSRQRTS
jgi:uncharacterized damage-inducible protein DinB